MEHTARTGCPAETIQVKAFHTGYVMEIHTLDGKEMLRRLKFPSTLHQEVMVCNNQEVMEYNNSTHQWQAGTNKQLLPNKQAQDQEPGPEHD